MVVLNVLKSIFVSHILNLFCCFCKSRAVANRWKQGVCVLHLKTKGRGLCYRLLSLVFVFFGGGGGRGMYFLRNRWQILHFPTTCLLGVSHLQHPPPWIKEWIKLWMQQPINDIGPFLSCPFWISVGSWILSSEVFSFTLKNHGI